MNNELLLLLEQNARLSYDELATMLDMDAAAVKAAVQQYERDGVIRGYTAMVDWDKTDRDYVTARIEVKASPKKDKGFEELAEQLAEMEEVRAVYLMSGGYDLAVTIGGKSFKEIASFVAYRLAPIDSVQSTATHFTLRKYKEKGVVFHDVVEDERGVML